MIQSYQYSHIEKDKKDKDERNKKNTDKTGYAIGGLNLISKFVRIPQLICVTMRHPKLLLSHKKKYT